MFFNCAFERYSPKWSLAAKDIEEGDASIEERMDRKQRALSYTIAFACLLKVPDYRLMADIEDARDLPIGLTARRPHQALALAFGKLRSRELGFAAPFDPSRSFECKGTDELQQWQVFFGEFPVRRKREGA
jgi:hypothetical protein